MGILTHSKLDVEETPVDVQFFRLYNQQELAVILRRQDVLVITDLQATIGAVTVGVT